jgi:hypothetical protein
VRSDEAILGSDGGVTKNIGVVSRINAIKAAWRDKSTCFAAVSDSSYPAAELAIETPNAVTPTSTMKSIFPICGLRCCHRTYRCLG